MSPPRKIEENNKKDRQEKKDIEGVKKDETTRQGRTGDKNQKATKTYTKPTKARRRQRQRETAGRKQGTEKTGRARDRKET